MMNKKPKQGNHQVRAVMGSLLGGVGGGVLGLILGPKIGPWLVLQKPSSTESIKSVFIDVWFYFLVQIAFAAIFGILLAVVGAVLGSALATSPLGEPDGPAPSEDRQAEELNRLRERITQIEEKQRKSNE
jgi:hypothetical protein